MDCPYLFIRYDMVNNITITEIGWPKDVDKNKLIGGFANVILAIQTGMMNNTIYQAIMNRGQSSGDFATSEALLKQLDAGIANLETHNEIVDEICMYPGEVFGQKQGGDTPHP